MRGESGFVRGVGVLGLISDRDWMTVLAALLNDAVPDGRQLARRLLKRTKPGRLVRVLRLLNDGEVGIARLQALLKVSRRTVFRDLNDLEALGVRFHLNSDGYRIARLPAALRGLLQ